MLGVIVGRCKVCGATMIEDDDPGWGYDQRVVCTGCGRDVFRKRETPPARPKPPPVLELEQEPPKRKPQADRDEAIVAALRRGCYVLAVADEFGLSANRIRKIWRVARDEGEILPPPPPPPKPPPSGRDEAIVAALRRGCYVLAVADEFGLSANRIRQIWRVARDEGEILPPPPPKPEPPPKPRRPAGRPATARDRDAAIVGLLAGGADVDEVAGQFGLTRRRTRQIYSTARLASMRAVETTPKQLAFTW